MVECHMEHALWCYLMCCTSYLLNSEWSMCETYTFKTAMAGVLDFLLTSSKVPTVVLRSEEETAQSALSHDDTQNTPPPHHLSHHHHETPPPRTPYTDRWPLGCAKRWGGVGGGGRRPGSMRGTNPLAYLFIYREKADIFKKQIVKWRMLWIIAFSSLAYGTNWIAVEVGWELPFKQVSPLWGGKMPDTY